MGLRKIKKFKYKINKLWYYEQQLLGLNYRMTDVSNFYWIKPIKKIKKLCKY